MAGPVVHTADSLRAFEERVKTAFAVGEIRAPVHLSGGNEIELLEVFRSVEHDDWVFSNWRSHYHALLKGIPEEEIFRQILAGRSMFISSREHRFIASSIVGGILPIACGVALASKRRLLGEAVWVFVGDMTARTGLFHEFMQYSMGHGLPVQVVIEDNGLSTDSPTTAVWGEEQCPTPVIHYRYQRVHPHVGIGKRVQF